MKLMTTHERTKRKWRERQGEKNLGRRRDDDARLEALVIFFPEERR